MSRSIKTLTIKQVAFSIWRAFGPVPAETAMVKFQSRRALVRFVSYRYEPCFVPQWEKTSFVTT